MPSARAHLERDNGALFSPPAPESEAPSLNGPESAAEMDRSEGVATAGNEPMDE